MPFAFHLCKKATGFKPECSICPWKDRLWILGFRRQLLQDSMGLKVTQMLSYNIYQHMRSDITCSSTTRNPNRDSLINTCWWEFLLQSLIACKLGGPETMYYCLNAGYCRWHSFSIRHLHNLMQEDFGQWNLSNTSETPVCLDYFWVHVSLAEIHF